MTTFREKLMSGSQLGLGIFYPASGIIERIGPDWDWLWIDDQHGQLDYTDILKAVRACNLIRRPAVVRVPGHEAGTIGKILDTAAEAVMVPMVEDAEQARSIVKAAKFPPLGNRSYGARRLIDLFGRGYAQLDKEQPLCVCQIENEQGLKNVASIAAVDGVDALFFGADDLSLARRLPMDKPRANGYFDEALQTVAQAANANGKIAGGVFTHEQGLSKAVEMGYTFIVGLVDASLLANGSKDAATRLRNCLGTAKIENNEDATG